MNKKELSDEQKSFIANAINMFGDGGHPVAFTDTVEYFTEDYIIEVVRKTNDFINWVEKIDMDWYKKMANTILETT